MPNAGSHRVDWCTVHLLSVACGCCELLSCQREVFTWRQTLAAQSSGKAPTKGIPMEPFPQTHSVVYTYICIYTMTMVSSRIQVYRFSGNQPESSQAKPNQFKKRQLNGESSQKVCVTERPVQKKACLTEHHAKQKQHVMSSRTVKDP